LPWCRFYVGPTRDIPRGAVGAQDVIGPSSAPLWAVTFSLHRLAAQDSGVDFIETRHVRAATYDGAILLTREMVPEKIIDVEASQITTKGEA
jgi:hypothetical protein